MIKIKANLVCCDTKLDVNRMYHLSASKENGEHLKGSLLE